jgi:hypothetical protein
MCMSLWWKGRVVIGYVLLYSYFQYSILNVEISFWLSFLRPQPQAASNIVVKLWIVLGITSSIFEMGFTNTSYDSETH